MTEHEATNDPAEDYKVENPVPEQDNSDVEVDVQVTRHDEDANPTQHKGDFVDEEGSND
jgi:hypothetical protein